MLNRRNNERALQSYDPFHDLSAIERNFFSNPFDFFGSRSLSPFKTDIQDAGDAYVLKADLPGFDKKDIELSLENDALTIKAQRRNDREEKDEDGNFICRERSYGSFVRRFDVSGVCTEDIKAKYENGVLNLHMPKKEEKRSSLHRLEIE